MGKIVEFEDVYLEYPDELDLESEEEIFDRIYSEPASKTAKLSLEELQRRLEETQSLRL